MRISLFVDGQPEPKGSARAFKSANSNRVVFAMGASKGQGARLAAWCKRVAFAARAEMRGLPPATGPVEMSMTFAFDRPKSRKGEHVVKPDLDKLERAILDAMTGIVYVDDSQVWRVVDKRKVYVGTANAPGRAGVQIEITTTDATALKKGTP